jgi:VWFA-related protein
VANERFVNRIEPFYKVNERAAQLSLRFAVALIASQALYAQASSQDALPTFRAESNLVILRFQVRANNKRSATEIAVQDIDVTEDGVSQKITLFEGGRRHPRKTPLDVHFLFDCSGSMRAAHLLNPRLFDANLLEQYTEARIGLWGFGGDQLVYIVKPTRDTSRLNWAMHRLQKVPGRNTPLYWAIAETVRRARDPDREVPQVLVVISDGIPTWDDGPFDEAVQASKNAGISVYPAWVSAGHGDRFSIAQEPPQSPITRFLTLGDETGGTPLWLDTPAKDDPLEQILKWLANEISYDYIVGFQLTASSRKRSHRIQVRLKSARGLKIVGGMRIIEN